MKKIPTVFRRDFKNSRGRHVLREVTEGCEWVLAGEGVATRKFDGTAVRLLNGHAYKRREWKDGTKVPDSFEEIDYDEATGKHVGWVPLDRDDPSDKWHWQALDDHVWADGTYELCGPKIQGNPEGFDRHVLVSHGQEKLVGVPRDYDGLKKWLAESDFEGVVWWHPDGRKAKLKKRDFPHG